MVDITDDFNRADGPLGSNYTASYGAIWNVASNEAEAPGAVSWYSTMRTNETFADDQYAQLEYISGSNSGTWCGPMVRCTSGGYLYNFVNNGGNCQIWRRDGGSSGTQLDTITQSLSANDVMKITIEGTTIKTYLNGSELTSLTTTDSTYTSGDPGLYAYDDGSPFCKFDNFAAGDIASGVFEITLSDNISVTDGANPFIEAFRELLSTFNLTDTVNPYAEIFRTLSNSIDVTDSIFKYSELLRLVQDNISLSDSVLVDVIRNIVKILSDEIEITDSTLRFLETLKLLTDNMSIVDELIITLTQPGEGQIFDITLSDSIGITENFIIARETFKVLLTSLLVSEEAVIERTFNMSLDDTVQIIDSMVKNVEFLKLLNEAVSINDTMARDLQILKLLQDTLNLSDSISLPVVFNIIASVLMSLTSKKVDMKLRDKNISMGLDSDPKNIDFDIGD